MDASLLFNAKMGKVNNGVLTIDEPFGEKQLENVNTIRLVYEDDILSFYLCDDDKWETEKGRRFSLKELLDYVEYLFE